MSQNSQQLFKETLRSVQFRKKNSLKVTKKHRKLFSSYNKVFAVKLSSRKEDKFLMEKKPNNWDIIFKENLRFPKKTCDEA